MTEGIVKWFNSRRGFGFIRPDEGGPDLFAHHSCIDPDRPADMHEGQRVRFAVGDDERGP